MLCLRLAVGALLAGFAAAAPTRAYQRLVVYGDSISDDAKPRGAFTLTNGTWPADPAYSKGRFSNGPVWAQIVSKELGLNLDDWATGGATADNNLVAGFTGPQSTVPVPGLVQQVNAYLATKPKTDGSIYALVIGANDIFFSSNVTASQVIGRVASAAASLRKKGARAFLIGAEYGFDEAPFAANASSSDKALYANYARDLRARAQKLVNELKQDGSKAALLDFYTVTQQAFEDPAKYGFAAKYRQVACLQGAYGGTRSLCTNPDKHLWWDDYHLTTRGHQRLAAEAEKRIASL